MGGVLFSAVTKLTLSSPVPPVSALRERATCYGSPVSAAMLRRQHRVRDAREVRGRERQARGRVKGETERETERGEAEKRKRG
jgi:hypothetical protein